MKLFTWIICLGLFTATMLSGCGSRNKLSPEQQAVNAANASAQALLDDFRAAQEAFRAAEGRYAHYLAEFGNYGHADLLPDLDDVNELLVRETAALRLIGIDGDNYVAVAAARQAGTGVAWDYTALPHEQLGVTAPYRAYLMDESGRTEHKPAELEQLVINAVNRKARAAAQRLLDAQAEFMANNGVYATLAQLAESRRLPGEEEVWEPYIDWRMLGGSLGDGVFLGMVTTNASFNLWVRAGPGGDGYYVYTADESGVITETDALVPVHAANASVQALLDDFRAAQEAFRAREGRYLHRIEDFHLHEDLLPDGADANESYIYGLIIRGTAALRLIGIDDDHYVAVAAAREAGTEPLWNPYGSEFLPHEHLRADAPYKAYLMDEGGKLTDKPATIEQLTIEAVNRKARAAVQRLVEAQLDFMADNGGEGAHSLAVLVHSERPRSDLMQPIEYYIDEYTGSGSLGDGVLLYMTLITMDHFMVQGIAGPGKDGYKVYNSDESGVITELEAD